MTRRKQRDKPRRTNEIKGQERNLEQQSQKSPNFGLSACSKLKYSTLLCLILKKSICQVKILLCYQDKGHINVIAAQKLIK